MKNLDYYIHLPYTMVVVPDNSEGEISYVVSFPELPGCITIGKTAETAIKNAEDAKENWLIAALEDGVPIQEPTLVTS